MDNRSHAPAVEPFGPTREALWKRWIAFYIFAGGASALGMALCGYFSWDGVISCLIGFIFWPLGLGFILTNLLERMEATTELALLKPVIAPLAILSIPIGYVILGLHLDATLNVTSERKFRLLMFSLVLLTSACVVGCAKFSPDFMPRQH